MYKFVALSLLIAAAVAVPTPEVGVDCLQSEDIFSCFAIKATATLNRAARSSEVQIFDGISFVRETPLERSGKSMPLSERQMLNELPKDVSERAMKLSSLIYDSALNFFKSYSLKVDSEGAVARAIESKVSEGRAKVKKYILPIIYSVLGVKAFALIPVIFGVLALLVLKALVIGKVALLVAGILAFQKYMGSGTGFNFFTKPLTATPGWTDPASQAWPAPANTQQQGYYRRSFEQDAHNLAYSAHVQTTTQTS